MKHWNLENMVRKSENAGNKQDFLRTHVVYYTPLE